MVFVLFSKNICQIFFIFSVIVKYIMLSMSGKFANPAWHTLENTATLPFSSVSNYYASLYTMILFQLEDQFYFPISLINNYLDVTMRTNKKTEQIIGHYCCSDIDVPTTPERRVQESRIHRFSIISTFSNWCCHYCFPDTL